MLVKVRHDLPKVGFVKVPRDDKGTIRAFVNVAAEHIVEFGQSHASVCLWWNINSNNNDRLNLAGQIEWPADNVLDEASRNAMGWRYSWGLTISC